MAGSLIGIMVRVGSASADGIAIKGETICCKKIPSAEADPTKLNMEGSGVRRAGVYFASAPDRVAGGRCGASGGAEGLVAAPGATPGWVVGLGRLAGNSRF